MENAALVRVVDRLGDELDVAGGPRRRQRLLAHELRQALALDVIHREVVLAFVDAHFVNRDDVRMLQNGGGGGLGPETLHEFLARQRSGQDHLHRDDAPETPLPRLINDAHAAARNLFQQFVVAERSQRELSAASIATAAGWPEWSALRLDGPGCSAWVMPSAPIQGALGAQALGPVCRQKRPALGAMSGFCHVSRFRFR